MRNVNIHEAKTHFSKLVDTVMQGEEIIIARAGKPAARLVPLCEAPREIRFGLLQGEVEIADDFDAPLPKDILAGFEAGK
ncbi:MAG: type II toxin-antitoxin system Phd/YefM family antitoxin [Desulfurivibrionaceae bacterium]